MTTWS